MHLQCLLLVDLLGLKGAHVRSVAVTLGQLGVLLGELLRRHVADSIIGGSLRYFALIAIESNAVILVCAALRLFQLHVNSCVQPPIRTIDHLHLHFKHNSIIKTTVFIKIKYIKLIFKYFQQYYLLGKNQNGRIRQEHRRNQ